MRPQPRVRVRAVAPRPAVVGRRPVVQKKSSAAGMVTWLALLGLLGGGTFYFMKNGGAGAPDQAKAAHTAPPVKHDDLAVVPATSEQRTADQSLPLASLTEAPAPGATVAASRPVAPSGPVMGYVVEPAAKPAAVAQVQAVPAGPRLSLSSAVKIGDPDRVALLQAAKKAAAEGKWEEHFTTLKEMIANAAKLGSSLQIPQNLQALLNLPTPALAVEHAKFIRNVGVKELSRFSQEPAHLEFLAWLFERPQVLAAFNETIQPGDKPANALTQWHTIWADDPENRDKLASLAIACALVFDEPVRINPDIFGFMGVQSASDSDEEKAARKNRQKEATASARFRFYRDSEKRGALKLDLSHMMPWELVWVVDAPVPESELLWAQKNINYTRRTWGEAYGSIRYRMDRATQGVNPYSAYTLAEIKKEGGICGDQAYFSAITAKANGIPAMVIGGEGDRGGHAWFGYEIARNDWNLSTGRYADNYAAGTTRDPQTGRTVKEHELRQLTDPARRTLGYDQGQKLLALAKVLEDAKQRPAATAAIDLALRAAPHNPEVWKVHLDYLADAKVPQADWMRECEKARITFHDFSDLVQEFQQRQTRFLSESGDYEAERQLVHRQTARMGRRDQERTDLILDGVMQEAELAAKNGDGERVEKIFKGALREKGDELVAFKKIAARYYDWAKGHDQGPDVTRELIGFFDRKHPEPTGDVFAMGAYKGSVDQLIGMAKEQKLDLLEKRLTKRAEKMDDDRKKLAKLQSKDADR